MNRPTHIGVPSQLNREASHESCYVSFVGSSGEHTTLDRAIGRRHFQRDIITYHYARPNYSIERARYGMFRLYMPQDKLRPIDGRVPNDIEIHFDDFLREQKLMRNARPSTVSCYIAAMQLFLRTVKEADLHNIQDRSIWVGFFTHLNERSRLVGKEMQRTGVKASTIRTYRSRLGAFMRWLHNTGHIKANPILGIEQPHVQYVDRRFLTQTEIQRLLQVCKVGHKWVNDFLRVRNYTIIQLLLHTGVRRGELLGLCVQDVNMDTGTLTVRGETSKSKMYRQIPMSRELMVEMSDYLRARKASAIAYTTPSLFVSSTSDRGLSQEGLKHFVTLLAKESGVHFHLHRLRHTFAAELNRHNVSLGHLQQLMGHHDPRMTLAYGRNVSIDTLRHDVEKIGSDGYSR